MRFKIAVDEYEILEYIHNERSFIRLYHSGIIRVVNRKSHTFGSLYESIIVSKRIFIDSRGYYSQKTALILFASLVLL